MICRFVVKAECKFFHPFGFCFADESSGFFHGDVFIVPLIGFGGGGEESLIEFFRLTVSGAEFVSANRSVFLIGLPAASGDISAHNAFKRNGFGLFHEKRAAGEIFFDGPDSGGKLRCIGAENMIRRPGKEFEPEQGHRGQDAALVGDAVRHYAIECTDAVGRHKKETVAHVINIANFSAVNRFHSRDFGFKQSSVCIITHGRLPHRKNFDSGEFLSVPFAQAVAFTAFDFESNEFRAAEVFHDFGFHFCSRNGRGADVQRSAFSDCENLIKYHLVAGIACDPFNCDNLVIRDFELLAACAYDCVHDKTPVVLRYRAY